MTGNVSSGKRWRFYIVLLIVIVIIFGLIYGFKAYENHAIAQAIANAPANIQTISSGQAKKTTWYPNETSVASMTALQGVDITTQSAGKVIAIEFKSGQRVQKGQEIVRLEDASEIQQLNNYLATMRMDKLTMDRDYKVYKSGLISEQTYNLARAAYQESLANVKREQAAIRYKHIRAPFTGRIGIRQVNLGQYVSAGSTIANLQTVQPIYADFSLPDKYFNMTKNGLHVALEISSMPNRKFRGVVTAKSSAVSTTTRNFTVRAKFDNKDELLKPGMYAVATMRTGDVRNVIVVPRTAIVYSLYGNSIYTLSVAGSDKAGRLYKVKRVSADLGPVEGNNIIVKAGLNAGETVVVSGQLKITDGAKVRVDNSVKLNPMSKEKLKGS